MANLTNTKYWQDRAERLILAGEKSAQEVTNGLKKVYEEYYRKIVKDIESFYGQYASEQGISISDAMRKLSRTELKSYREQLQAYYDEIEKSRYAFDPAYKQRLSRELSFEAAVSRLEALKAEVQWNIENLYAREQEAFKTGLQAAYEDSYYRSVFDVQQGIGFGEPFARLSQSVINTAVNQKWFDGNYSTRIWEDKDRLTIALERIIPSGIAAGQNPRVIAKEISHQLDVRRSYSERLARTEFNFIVNQATAKSYEETGIEKYQFLATLDHRTSEICAETDKMIFALSEKIIGATWPPLHPNCRSTTVPYFEPDEIDALFNTAERVAKDPSGKKYLVPATMSYSEWAKEHGVKPK